jgi:hypothetical protein
MLIEIKNILDLKPALIEGHDIHKNQFKIFGSIFTGRCSLKTYILKAQFYYSASHNLTGVD